MEDKFVVAANCCMSISSNLMESRVRNPCKLFYDSTTLYFKTSWISNHAPGVEDTYHSSGQLLQKLLGSLNTGPRYSTIPP